mmetsp:Transcript_7004/g.17881  ORF Transcript_7004/g.17881 Transcript_7004/m.17881 type:complete len:87 (-) Transcript_7004:13-273(-)
MPPAPSSSGFGVVAATIGGGMIAWMSANSLGSGRAKTLSPHARALIHEHDSHAPGAVIKRLRGGSGDYWRRDDRVDVGELARLRPR